MPEPLTITASSKVSDACRLFDTCRSAFAAIVDERNHLCGLVSDHGLRRALLMGLSQDSSIITAAESIYTAECIGSPQWRGYEEIAEQMADVVVLIDRNNHVLGLRPKKAVLRNFLQSIPVILMVGGSGTRLQPLTEHCPKPLLPIKGKPLLESNIERLFQLGFRQIVLATGYGADKIRSFFGDGSHWGMQITYIHEPERLGTCGALRLLSQRPEQAFVVMNGDLITDVKLDSLLDFHKRSSAMATFCVAPYDVKIPYGVVETNGTKLSSIKEKPVTRHWINAGIYVLESACIDHIPAEQAFDMPNLLQKISSSNQVAVYPIWEKWVDIGSLAEYERANSEPDKINNLNFAPPQSVVPSK